MKNSTYNIPEDQVQKASEPVVFYGGITIPVTLPTIGNYTVDSLSRELTEIAMKLISSKKSSSEHNKSYSPKLQHLRAMSQNRITEEDIETDERLAYLIDK